MNNKKDSLLVLAIIGIYSFSLITRILEILPLTIIPLVILASKRNKLILKLIVSTILPSIYFFPFNFWVDIKKEWYIIPVTYSTAIIFSFFIFTQAFFRIIKDIKRKNNKCILIKSLIISLCWILSLKLGEKITKTEPIWLFFSYRWFKSYFSVFNPLLFEFIIFLSLGYIALSFRNYKRGDLKIALLLIIIIIISFFIPENIEHPEKENILLVNLNLDFSYTHREENLPQIVDLYLEYIKQRLNNSTDLVILPEYVITKDWRHEKEIINKFLNLTKTRNISILVGTKEDIDKEHFYNVALYIRPNKKIQSLKDVYPMVLSTNIKKGKEIPKIKYHNKTFAILICFSSTQYKFWKKIKNDPNIKGVFILANEQALHSFLKKESYYLIRYFERYVKKPVYKAANEGINYPSNNL